jgi:hypothetical protein
MALTVEWILAAEDDKALFNLLSGELERLLPKEVQRDRDLYHQTLADLPRGLRAMAGIFFLDVSIAIDDLAWHFGNQNDERYLQETLNGLHELELFEVADLFEKAWKIMAPHLDKIRRDDWDGMNPTDWYEKIGVQQRIDPMDAIIRTHCKRAGKLGLLESWVPYARKYPGRCAVSVAVA